ncbi:MAG: MTAP family purine nucleoside phosphorylase [bacterium]
MQIEVKNAVIGGSKAYTLLNEGKVVGERVGEIQTPFGKSQPIFLVKDKDIEFLFLTRHGEKSYELNASSVNYQANIYALKELGVERILAWSGPGAINEDLKPGQYLLPDDLIDETKSRVLSFYSKNSGIGFIRSSPVFCPQLSNEMEVLLNELGFKGNKGGVYVCTEGPRLETKAEIKKFKLLGADVVGMTLIPEVFLARELEMCYVALCYITNYAEGIKEKKGYKKATLFDGLITKEVMKKVDKAVQKFPEIIKEFYKSLLFKDRNCNCNQLMARYKERIGNNWHNWIPCNRSGSPLPQRRRGTEKT